MRRVIAIVIALIGVAVIFGKGHGGSSGGRLASLDPEARIDEAQGPERWLAVS